MSSTTRAGLGGALDLREARAAEPDVGSIRHDYVAYQRQLARRAREQDRSRMSWADLQAVQAAHDSGRTDGQVPVGRADLPVPHLDHLRRSSSLSRE
jgi:hypothetical protein